MFVVPDEIEVNLPRALILRPEEKTTITIDQVREVIARLGVRQTSELFVIIRPAEALGEEAANALLKNLEEPGEKVHFVLVTDALSRLLPTILSRANVYFLRQTRVVDGEIKADKKILDLARRMVVARGADLPALAEELTKKKDGVRAHVLSVLAVAVEMLYKSYFKTGKEVFLAKIPKFLAAYDAILKNGHVKLHLVADLI